MKSKSVRCLVKSLYCKDTAAMYTTYQSVKLSINLIKIRLSIKPMKLGPIQEKTQRFRLFHQQQGPQINKLNPAMNLKAILGYSTM